MARSLLAILLLLTLVSISAVSWLGWRLISQERVVESQKSRERLDQAADRIAGNFRRSLEGDVHLDGTRLTLHADSFAVLPPGGLLFYPRPATDPEAPGTLYREGEAFEFRDAKPLAAIASYERMAETADAAMRAGALMRLARVLRKTGRRQESLARYRQLRAITGVRVAGVPAELVARHEICELEGHRQDTEKLLADLANGRWQLRRGQFEFYWDEVSRLLGRHEAPDPNRVALAEAAVLASSTREAEQVVHVEGIPILLVRRGSISHKTVLMTTVDSVLQQITAGEDVYCAALDGSGRKLAGRTEGASRAILRSAVEFHIPWTLAVTGRAGVADVAIADRERFLRTVIVMMVVFLLSGTYFIARAIRREAEVSRLQSDFVSAVSHEFRTPLTSMRQLSEILAEGRAPSDGRRQVYYETLVGETKRLERLVETLLTFGRMEARADRYRLEAVEAGQLVEHAVAAFEMEFGNVRRIERTGETNCRIRADIEAFGVALRNLLDNAIKYSRPGARVRVEWARTGTQVEILVRDEGLGITAQERKAIFEKFVRGSAATSLDVKGTGVGLALVRQIVAGHRGQIRVESEMGKGSTFAILLPAEEV